MAKNNYKKSEQTFINPYNFVSSDWNKTDRKSVEKGEKSGVLHCRLQTITPLAIPSFRERINDHNYYDFMRNTNGVPMIPGSSLRGAVRSVYEALTDSCYSTSKKDQIITKRASMQEIGKPGLLIRDNNGKWALYNAKRYLVVISDKEYAPLSKIENAKKYSRDELHEIGQGAHVSFDIVGKHISIKKKKINGKEITEEIEIGDVVNNLKEVKDLVKKPNKQHGYLCIGEVPPQDKNGKPQTNKHFESVFEKTNKTINGLQECDIEKGIESIRKLLDLYNDPAVNHNASENHTFYKGVSDCIKRGIVPIWFRMDEQKLKLSLAAIGRIKYENDIGKLLGNKRKCRDRKCLCAACRLFGMIGEEKEKDSREEEMGGPEKAIGGRVRFTDAVLLGDVKKDTIIQNDTDIEKDTIIQNVTLKELGTPRLSYIPFYANKKDGTTADSYDEKDIVLKGRKFYWHDLSDNIYRAPCVEDVPEKTKRNATMDLVNKGRYFSFDVYYDCLTESELEELIWVLSLGDNNDGSTKCYKIGHGKPIGLGSAKIVIKSNLQRTYNNENGYQVEETENPAPKDLFKSSLREELDIILDIKAVEKENVSYPYIVDAIPNDNDTAPHQWFSQNRQSKKNNLDQPLPTIKQVEDGSVKLYAYKNRNNCVEVTITRVAKSGGIFFEDSGKTGTVSAKNLKGKSFRRDDKVKVSFQREITFDEGKTVRFYTLVE